MLRKDKKATADTKTKDVEKNKDQGFFTKFSILIVSMKFLWFIGHVVVST